MRSITRTALHDLVWSKPLTEVGADFDLHPTTLMSICRQNDIPTPPPHYWRMVANGSPATRRALPTDKFRRNHLVHIGVDASPHREEQEALSKTVPLATGTPVQATVADEEITGPDAVKIRKELRRASKAGEVKARLRLLQVNISEGSIDRATSVLAEIQSRFEERSWRAATGDGGAIVVGEDRVELLLSEGTQRVPHIPTLREVRDRQRYGSWIPEHDVVRSGRLELSVTNAAYLGVRQKWADGKRQRIEDILDSFVEGVQSAANAIKARRLERDEQQRRWEEQRRQREERERLESIERIRGAVLRQQAAAHEEARRLHAYIEAVKTKFRTSDENAMGIQEWLAWAENHVANLDPLTQGLPTLLSEEEALRLRWTFPKQ